jgi:ferredoxin
MPHVVAEPCIECRSLHCVEVCPVDCFIDAGTLLVIDPEVCIDCEACVPACPVGAIFPSDALPDQWSPFRDLNAMLARQRPRITRNSDASS